MVVVVPRTYQLVLVVLGGNVLVELEVEEVAHEQLLPPALGKLVVEEAVVGGGGGGGRRGSGGGGGGGAGGWRRW